MYQQCPILIINVKTGKSHRCKNNIIRLGVCYEHMLPVWREILRLTPPALDEWDSSAPEGDTSHEVLSAGQVPLSYANPPVPSLPIRRL